MVLDNVGKPEPTPERLEDIEIAIRPRIHHAPGRLLRHDLLRGTPPQDTARQPPEPCRHIGVIGASAIIDNTDFGALLLGVPDAFGQLQMGEDRAIGPLLMSLTQVHVLNDTSSYM